MSLERIEKATVTQAQRLDQALFLEKRFDIAQARPDGQVKAKTSEGMFEFYLDNHQRAIFYNMLRGRLRSMPWEGLGNVGYELIGGRISVR